MGYPSTIPDLTESVPAGTAKLGDVTATRDHTGHHTQLGTELQAVMTELGTNPKGGAASVKARLDALDTTVAGKAATSHTQAASTISDSTTVGRAVLTAADAAAARAAIGAAATTAISGALDYLGPGPHATYDKPAGLVYVDAIYISGGGGGGGGGKSDTGNSCRGVGAGPGRVVFRRIPASALGSSEAITIGATAQGGAGATTATTAGTAGDTGASVTFAGLTVPGGGGGPGGPTSGVAADVAAVAGSCCDPGGLFFANGGGSAGASAPLALSRLLPTGGGAGGSNSNGIGSSGGAYNANAVGYPTTGAAGGAGGGTPTAGANGVAVELFGTGGGGGGGTAVGGLNGGRGGDGGGPGAGGGGGGGTSNGAGNAGRGGDGGPGRLILIPRIAT